MAKAREALERLTSEQAALRSFLPEYYVLVCGICQKAIKTVKAYSYDAGPLVEYRSKRYGECHRKCFLEKLTPAKRAEKLREERLARKYAKADGFLL